MTDTLNDFIHAGAARMFEDNSMTVKQDYSYYEGQLRDWVKKLIENPEYKYISSMGWVLNRKKNAQYVEWRLDRQALTFYDEDSPDYYTKLLTY